MFLDTFLSPCINLTSVAEKLRPLQPKTLIPFAISETRLSAPKMRFFQFLFFLIVVIVDTFYSSCIDLSSVASRLGPLEVEMLIPFAIFETRVLVRNPYSIRGFWEVRALPLRIAVGYT